MASGGARVFSGPPPDPNAHRRDRPSDQAGWTTLPGPREGPLPAWPLTESTKREDAMWARLWSTPQAVLWERLGLTDEVAAYVRTFIEGSEKGASATLRTLVLRQQEGLGLSTAGMNRLRWRLAPPDEPRREVANGPRRTSASARFKAIQGGKAG